MHHVPSILALEAGWCAGMNRPLKVDRIQICLSGQLQVPLLMQNAFRAIRKVHLTIGAQKHLRNPKL
jgi:hypothetical protein